MRQSKRLWAVLLVAVAVAGLLVGFGTADEAVAKEPRATIGKIMIPAAAFVPENETYGYENDGWMVRGHLGGAMFVAPVWLPEQVVSIRRITLIADDSVAGASVCLFLLRPRQLVAVEPSLAAQVCTVDSPDLPQKVATTAISPRRVRTGTNGPYLRMTMDASTVSAFGVQIIYTY